MRWLVIITLVSLGFLGCQQICASRSELFSSDAGVVPCVRSTDCPRPANVIVCDSTLDQLHDCVGCESNQCVRYQPGACQ